MQLFNLPKWVDAALLTAEGLLSLLFYCECGINQYTGQKTLAVVFRARLLLLVFGCFRNIVLPYHLKMLPHGFMRRQHLFSEIISLVFCSVQYLKTSTYLNTKLNSRQPIVFSSPNKLLAILIKASKIFLVRSKFLDYGQSKSFA